MVKSGALPGTARVESNRAPVFSWEIRVYYEDTDAAGVVYHANYLRFMERARTEWLRALGFKHQELVTAYGGLFIAHAVDVRFLRPGVLNDLLTVSVQPRRIAGAQVTLFQGVWRQGEEIARADVSIAWVDAHTFKPKRLPRPLITRMNSNL